jgi:D-alanine transaminase
MELSRGLGIEVVEEPFNREFLLAADEVFLTGTYLEIVPVNTVNGTQIGPHKPKDVTKSLQKKLAQLVSR